MHLQTFQYKLQFSASQNWHLAIHTNQFTIICFYTSKIVFPKHPHHTTFTLKNSNQINLKSSCQYLTKSIPKKFLCYSSDSDSKKNYWLAIISKIQSPLYVSQNQCITEMLPKKQLFKRKLSTVIGNVSSKLYFVFQKGYPPFYTILSCSIIQPTI